MDCYVNMYMYMYMYKLFSLCLYPSLLPLTPRPSLIPAAHSLPSTFICSSPPTHPPPIPPATQYYTYT